jgi:iron complex outermembrane receptor protein
MASYPMPDDGERDFVNLSAIPLEAIERIEVLKDGASAVYGSDAMAGVVNVILKKSYSGSMASAEIGTSYKHDGTTRHYSFTTGTGDLNTDGYTAYVSFEFRHQNPVRMADRDYLNVTDWSAFSPDGQNLDTGNPYFELVPKTQSFDVLGRVVKALPNDWQLSFEASAFNSAARQLGVFNDVTDGVTSFNFGPRNASSPVPYNSANFPYTFTPPANAGSDWGWMPDVGPQTQQSHTATYRAVLELTGAWSGWSVEAALGLTRSQMELTSSNFVSLSGLQAALDSGSYSFPVNPSFPYARRASDGVYAQIAPTGSSTSTNDLHFLSLRGTRELMPLPGGPLAIGTGVEFTHRSLHEEFPDNFARGDQYSPIYAFAIGQQNVTAAYAEVVAPLLKGLELDAALRVDHYDTYGNSTTPKLGLKYSPSRQFTVRGTYAQGFRAPNPAEMGTAGSTSGVLNPLNDPLHCTATDSSGCGITFPELQVSNPNLKPEKSQSYTLGLIVEPSRQFNLSLDYYDITIKDQIVSVGLLGQLQLNDPAAYGATLYRDPATTQIVYETYPFINASRTRTSGIDADLRARFDLHEAGRLTAELNLTHMLQYDMTFGGTTYALAGTHGPGFISGDTGTPKDRAALSLKWEYAGLEMTGTLNYISSFSVLDPTGGINDCGDALINTFHDADGNAVTPPSQFCRVGSLTTFNLAGRYNVNDKLALSASVTNLFNAHAPYDLQTFGTPGNGAQYGGAPYNPALHQDGALGRFITVGASYRF